MQPQSSALSDFFSGITSVAKDISATSKDLLTAYGEVRKTGIDAGIKKAEINADVQKAQIAAKQRETEINASTTGRSNVSYFLTGSGAGGIPNMVYLAGAGLLVAYLIWGKK